MGLTKKQELKIALENKISNYDLTEENHEPYNGIIIYDDVDEVIKYLDRWEYTAEGIAESFYHSKHKHFKYAIVFFESNGDKKWFHVADYWLNELLEALGSSVRYS